MSSLFKSQSLLLRKKSGGGYVKGQWQTGVPEDLPFMSSWQPVTGKTLELLPSGKREREVHKCFAPIHFEVTCADDHGEAEADTVVWEGKEYEVTTAQKWNNGLIPHWELLCTRPKAGDK